MTFMWGYKILKKIFSTLNRFNSKYENKYDCFKPKALINLPVSCLFTFVSTILW